MELVNASKLETPTKGFLGSLSRYCSARPEILFPVSYLSNQQFTIDKIVYTTILGTAICVLVDAKNIGVKRGLVSGLGNTGPWAWFFAVLLFWIVGFPAYLYYRGKFKLAVAAASVTVNDLPIKGVGGQSEGWAIKDLERLASLKERGFITDSEFEDRKKQILGL